MGIYVNPDELQKKIENCGFLDLSHYGVITSKNEILPFFTQSQLLQNAKLEEVAAQLRFHDGKLAFCNVNVNAYFASVAADFIRQKLMEVRASFSFETVMSSPDKITILKKAQKLGYRTYLYYIATEDSSINVARVKSRVKMGGHDVPEDKIITRYDRSLDLLLQAIKHTHRAYLFDNSREAGQRLWVAEITDGKTLELKSDPMPLWFQKYIWDKIPK